MFDVDAVRRAVLKPRGPALEDAVRAALAKVNSAALEMPKTASAPLDAAEVAQIVANIKHSFPEWLAYARSDFIFAIPHEFDTQRQLESMKSIIDLRERTAAEVLTRVLDWRLFWEIRRVRGTLGQNDATAPREGW